MIRTSSTVRRLARAVATLGVAASLSACVSLFPKEDPATLYRFGSAAAPAPAAPPASAPAAAAAVGVLKAPTGFPRAASGDQILTITGGEAAYISTARWVSPAAVLFDEAVFRTFDAGSGPARLIARGEIARADLVLKLDVRSFETVYIDGTGTAPEVQVSVRAVLTRNSDRSLIGDQMFEARVRAADNRVSAIVPAYDAAVGQTLRDILLWVNTRGVGATS